MSRLSSGEQSLDEQTTSELIDSLKNKVLEQRKKKLILSIHDNVKLVESQ